MGALSCALARSIIACTCCPERIPLVSASAVSIIESAKGFDPVSEHPDIAALGLVQMFIHYFRAHPVTRQQGARPAWV